MKMIEQGLAFWSVAAPKERLEELRHTQEQTKKNHVYTSLFT